MSACEVRSQIVNESVIRVKALLDQACALRRAGVNVESIIARLEATLDGWTGQTGKAGSMSWCE